MRDVRLLLVLVMALGIIVVGGVAIPTLFNLVAPPGERAAPPGARAAEKAPPLPPMPADLDRLSERFRAVARRVKPAVVAIGVSQTVETSGGPLWGDDFFRRFFGPYFGERGRDGQSDRKRKFQRQGLGSGIIVDPQGYILTNNHVVENADEITVRLADGREFDAEVIGADPPTEIAVIRIKATDLPAARLGDAKKMEVGDWSWPSGRRSAWSRRLPAASSAPPDATAWASPITRTSSRPTPPSTPATRAGRSST